MYQPHLFSFKQILVLLSIFSAYFCQTNQSICNTFWLDGLYYTVNTDFTNQNKINNTRILNYCQQVEYYCVPKHKVVKGSMIVLSQNDCYEYQQQYVGLISPGIISGGLKVGYKYTGSVEGVQLLREDTYLCDAGKGKGCPEVQSSTIFSFFQDKLLGFTIGLEIIGIIFMTLGVYVYRASIVLLGASTMFIILLAVQTPIIFYPGVPADLISNILVISAICSFFAGYVFGYFPKLGIFMLGSWIGFIISLTLSNIAFYFIKTNPANLTLWIVLPILCVLFGILSLFIRRAFIIFATSLIGAYFCLRGLSWYLGAFPNQFLMARRYQLGMVGTVSWKFYIYVIALIILTGSSAALQNWMFKKKSKLGNHAGNIDEEFGNIEMEMKAKRENLAEIANFKEVFKNKGKGPKILKRKSESQYDDYSQSADLDYEVQQPSQERPAISKKDLNKRLIHK